MGCGSMFYSKKKKLVPNIWILKRIAEVSPIWNSKKKLDTDGKLTQNDAIVSKTLKLA